MDSYNASHERRDDRADELESQAFVGKRNGTSSASYQRGKEDDDALRTMFRLYELVTAKERQLYLLSGVTLAFTSLVQLTTPFLTGHIIDTALLQQQEDSDEGSSFANQTVLMLVGLFGVLSFAALLSYYRTVWQVQASQMFTARLRRHAYWAMLCQDAEYFDNIKTGDLLTRLTSDVDIIQSAIQDGILGGMRSVVMAVGAASMLLWISWSLAAVALAILPATMTAARWVGRGMRERQKKVRELHAAAAVCAEQAFTCISVVHQFVAENHEAHKYNAAIHQAHYRAIETERLQAAFSGTVQIVGNGSMLLVLGYGGSLVASGELSAGALAGFVMYSLIMAGNASNLANKYVDLMKAVAAANRMFEVVDRTPAVPGPTSKIPIGDDDLSFPEYYHKDDFRHSTSTSSSTHMKPFSVDIRNISFCYPARKDAQVLGHNFSLSVQAGEIVALVGASGAGKSTVVALLSRLYDVSAGSILIDGDDIRHMSPHQVRQSVGIVAQEPLLFPISIIDNIRYGKFEATDDEVRTAARLANVLEFCDNFPDGINTVVGPRGTQLSGGQKQRVAIARAILKDPPIVVFDEATSALDAESEHHVQQAIDTAMKGRTVIVIAHRLSTIRNSNRIAVIQHGRVVEFGTFNELSAKTNGAFFDLMRRQVNGEKNRT